MVAWLFCVAIGVFLPLLYFTPLTLQLDLRRFDQTRGRIQLTWWCWTRQWHLAVVRTEHGHQVVLVGRRGTPTPIDPTAMRGSRGEQLLQSLLRDERTRRFLLHRIDLRVLNALICLRTEDAARSAVLSGTMQGAAGMLPPAWREKVHIRVTPDFFRDHTTIQARCILHLRLGTLIITAGMLLAAHIRHGHSVKKEAA